MPENKIDDGGYVFPDPNPKGHFPEYGITYRQWLVGRAMQGILASGNSEGMKNLIRDAYAIADALLAELRKDGE